MKREYRPNQLYRELLSVCGLNPWAAHDSSSRVQMFSSHLGQILIVAGATERRQQTGMEREYGKYTFDTKIPVNAQIIKVIPRYRKSYDENSINLNPQTIVIYEDVKTKEIGMVNIENFCSNHPYFGFEYKKRAGMNSIRQGEFVAGGTVLQSTPSLTDNGGYRFGVELNMAYMSLPGVSEDGIIISRDVLKKFQFKKYERRVVEFGTKRFPLNLYGDADHYKPFPEIGDVVRPDGILMALRSYDKSLAVVEQHAEALMTPDMIFDKLTYAEGAGGKIVDIVFHHELDNSAPGTPEGMDKQAIKYDNARRMFYQDILNEYNRLKKIRGAALQLTPEFHRQVVEALSVLSATDSKKIVKLHRRAPLDDWRLEFVIEYTVTPNIGFKLTDCHGGKGVICKIAEPHEMPIDDFGNRADLIMDPNSTISRMNIGRLYEQKVNAASRDVITVIRQKLGLGVDAKVNEVILETMNKTGQVTEAWNYLLGYYQICSPERMYKWFTEGGYDGKPFEHLAEVINKGIYLYLPPENEPESVDMAMAINERYKPFLSPVTFTGNSGIRRRSKENVLIGSMYIMLLEKTGDDWTAVSSGKVQHFGVLSQVTNADKYSQPTRQQAIRAQGEAEVRIYASYVGPRTTAEILDRNNNLIAHRSVVDSILSADKPTDIKVAVDREKIPFGNAKPQQLVRHLAECSGWKFAYEPHVPNWAKSMKK